MPWIDPTVAGQPEPQHPAPVLHLGTSGDQREAAASTASTTTGGGPGGWEIVAVVLSVVALVAGIGGLGLALASRRRATPSA